MKVPRIALAIVPLVLLAAVMTACGGGSSSGGNQPITPPPPPTGANYTTCNSQQVPNWQSSQFQTDYQAAISNLVSYYGQNPNIGYIRIGLGRGGEINLPKGWNDSSSGSCYGGYSGAWNYSVSGNSSSWSTYLATMVNFEGSLHSPKPLLVSITPITGESGTSTDDFIAGIAAQNNMSFGNQGLESSDIQNFPNCAGDWCNLFAQYHPQIAELQTLGQSCPEGTSCANSLSSSTGPLDPLLPFATAHGANNLELYYQDWLIAFDSDYANSQGVSTATAQLYATAIQTAFAAGATMQVLFPPQASDSSMCGSLTCYQAVVNLMSNLSAPITGVVVDVDWSDIEPSSGTFSYSIPDSVIQPWISAGKKVNLVFQNTTYGGNGNCPNSGTGSNGNVGSNCAMPPWMWTVLQ